MPGNSRIERNNHQEVLDTYITDMWYFVIKTKGKTVLYPLLYRNGTTGYTLMDRFRRKCKATKPTTCWWHGEPELEEVDVTTAYIGDSEAQDYPREVVIERLKNLPSLTSVFRNPSLLRGTGTHQLRDYSRFNFRPAAGLSEPCRAILVNTKPSGKLIAVGLAGAVLLSVGVGVSCGLGFHSAQAGITGVLATVAILTFIQVCLAGKSALS